MCGAVRMGMRISLLLFMILLLLPIYPVIGLGVGDKASDFALVDINGNSFTLSNCTAEVVLVDFFATWCGPCKAAIPTLRSLYHEYSRDQLEIISISLEDEGTLRTFAQRPDINMTWIVAQDTAGVSDDYDVTYIPRTFLVDANSYIRYDHTGWTSGDESKLHSKIISLLSGTENGDSDTTQQPPYTLIAVIGVGVIVFLVIGIVVARQLLGWSKAPKKGAYASAGAEKRLSNFPV